jgi:hypothetical protein
MNDILNIYISNSINVLLVSASWKRYSVYTAIDVWTLYLYHDAETLGNQLIIQEHVILND